MSNPADDARTEAAVWQAMVLFSTLQTAADVWQSTKERRAGHDPSEQEEATFVRGYLRESLGELQALAMGLRASLIAREDAGRIAALVRRFNDLSMLHRIARLLHVIHQRMLSLYPALDAALVEDARVLQTFASALLDQTGDAFLEQAEAFAHDVLRFCGDLHRAVWP